jgi:hypothetical protein
MTSKILITITLFIFISFNVYPLINIDKMDSANVASKKPVRVYYTTRLTTEKPVIDGILNDECWKTGEWASDFTQWVPKEGAKPSQKTEVKILYDDKNIYIAIRAYDNEPDKMIRKAGKRDEFAGDQCGITFDSYHDHRTGFEFDLTSAGQKIDLVLTNPSNADFNWNAVWYGKTGIEDSAWTAEFEIPLSQLRYSSDQEQVWGMHCWRWIDRLQEESDWEVQSSTSPGILYQFGELRGIKNLPQSSRIEIMPYSLGKLNTFQSDPKNPYADKGRTYLGNLGLDAKIGLSSNFTADITINPDFGQVESDPSVMNLSAFETFYEEKRPFFLEGRNIFSYDFDNCSIFYSRRIGHSPGYTPTLSDNEYMDFPDNTTILSALKLSGKTANGFSIGILESLTANENAKIDSAGITKNTRVEPLTNYFLARVQQDYDNGNTILGGIFTSTNRIFNEPYLEFLNRNAYTGGIDLYYQWADKEYFLDAKLFGSTINGSSEAIKDLQTSSAHYYQRPDANYLHFDSTLTQLSGYGGRIRIGKGSKGNFRYSTGIHWRSPGLDLNDMGYMQTADDIEQENALSYFIMQPESIFRTYSIGVTQYNDWDFGKEHLYSGASLNIYLEFLNKWAISNSVTYQSQTLDTHILRGGYSMLVPAIWTNNFYLRTDPSEKMFFDFNATFSEGVNKWMQYYYIQPEYNIMPINTLKLSISVNYSNNLNNLQYVNTVSADGSEKYILGKITQQTLGMTFRIDYNITTELSIQYYGSPFASVGKYSEFKAVTNPRASEYVDRYTTLNPILNNDNYVVNDNNTSQSNYQFTNPDFNFYQFRSNLVLRWEYRPGSQLYLVWSQDRTNYVNPGENSVYNAMSSLKNVHPNNIFLIKFNYWFTI